MKNFVSFVSILVTLAVVLISPIAVANDNPFKIDGVQAFWTIRDRTDFYGFVQGQDILKGMATESGVFVPFLIGEGGRIFFRFWGEYFFFRSTDVTTDPRHTDKWVTVLSYDQAPTLWGRVEHAAGTEELPTLTRAIIADMVREKVTTWEELGAKKMSPERLSAIMLAYTELIED